MKMFNQFTGSLALGSVVLVGVLSACGGGGDDEAGSPTAFSVQPSTVAFTAPAGTAAGVCTPGGSQDVFVYGGAAPYRIDNTVPSYVSVDRTTVDSRGGSFKLTVIGGCVTDGTIVVVDKLDHQVVFTVTNGPSTAASG